MFRTEDLFDESVQGFLRADLHEDPRAGVVQGLQSLDELHRLGDLPTEDLQHGLRVCGGRIEVTGHIRHDGQLGCTHLKAAHRDLQRLAGRGHDLRVERMRDGDAHGRHPGRLERGHGCLDCAGRAADDGLGVGVDVGHDDVAVHLRHDPLDVGKWTEDRGHRAVVVGGDVCHLPAAGADGLQSGVETQRAGGNERAILPEAVAHHQIGGDPVSGHQVRQRSVGGEHRGLRDLGLHELCFEAGDRFWVRGVAEHEVRQGLTQQRRHDPVGLVVDRPHDGFVIAQASQHVDVLRPLPGEQERDLGRRAAADEHTLRAQQFPHRRVVGAERLNGLVGFLRQIGGIGEVDRHTDRGRRQRGVGWHLGRGAAGRSLGGQRLQSRDDLGLIAAADHGRAAQGGLAFGVWGSRMGDRCGSRGPDVRSGEGAGGVGCLVSSGLVLLESDVEVGPAEAEGAHTGAARVLTGVRPFAQFGVDAERGRGPVHVGVGVVEVQARGKDLVVQAHHRLEHARGARGGLQMSDVRLDRAQGDGPRGQPVGGEDLVEGTEFGGVSHPGGRTVCLQHPDGTRIDSRVLPRPGNRKLLSDRVGRGDALALTVGRATDPEDHRVDVIPGLLCIRESLEYEQGSTLAHHEAVSPCIEGPGPRCRQGADLAEPHEGAGAHVVVDATGDTGVVVVGLQTGHGSVHGRQCRGARGVGGEVRPAQIEQRRDPACHDVRQLARHGVLGDGRKAGEEPLAGFGADSALDLGR